MITNFTFSSINEVLDALEKSHVTFYLTGSRYFGTFVKGSDWDFFIQRSENIGMVLSDLGFELVESKNYADSNTVEVWYHMKHPVHIQVALDASLKEEAQKYIQDQVKLGLRIPEGDVMRTLLWDNVFDLIKTKRRNNLAHVVQT